MLTLHDTIERLALTLPRFDDIKHASTAIATIFYAEILVLPVAKNATSTIGRDLRVPGGVSVEWLAKLVTCAIRALQEEGRAILIERGLGDADDRHGRHAPFLPAHAEVIQAQWDRCAEPPVWRAFKIQFQALTLAGRTHA